MRPRLLTLADDTEVSYQISAPYVADSARGVRFDDPAFGNEWPAEIVVIDDRDRLYPDYASEPVGTGVDR